MPISWLSTCLICKYDLHTQTSRFWQPPHKPPTENMSYSVCGSLLHLVINLVLLAVGVVWLLLIVFYGTQPWAPGPLNAWHHTKDFNIFMAFGILWIFLFRPVISSPLWASCAAPLRAVPVVHSIKKNISTFCFRGWYLWDCHGLHRRPDCTELHSRPTVSHSL